MKSLQTYIKRNAQKDIIARFDDLFKLAVESNRNKEWWETFRATKTEALIKDLRGENLDNFIAPLYETLNDDSLKSMFSKEQREANSAIWDNEEMKIKREAHKNQLHLRFRNFVREAREADCNDDFIEQIANRRYECYKHAFGLAEIDREIEVLRSNMLEPHNQLNDNQKLTKAKFDKVIDDLIRAQDENDIIINGYNSGNYNDSSSSLWTQIFTLEKEAISQNIEQEIVDEIIADCERSAKNVIKRLIRAKEVQAMKKEVNAESYKQWMDSLSQRQRMILIAFDDVAQKYIGKQNAMFWEEVFRPLKRNAVNLQSSDEELNEIFNEIETKAQETQYQKAQSAENEAKGA